MKSGDWTKFDVALVLSAVIVLVAMLSVRIYTEVQIDQAAKVVIANIRAINKVVHDQYLNTGRWFPKQTENDDRNHTLVYLDPFTANPPVYQNLDESWLRRESNYGIVLQLVRHDVTNDHVVDTNIFPDQLKTGEPYLRLLVEYGAGADLETAILHKAANQFGDLLVKIHNHLYVLELRELTDD